MADLPDFLTLPRNRDSVGRRRVDNIASLAQVRWAVLETNGQISFIKNDDPLPGSPAWAAWTIVCGHSDGTEIV
jgi:hypothetical protein